MIRRTGVTLLLCLAGFTAIPALTVDAQQAVDPQTAVNNAFNQFRTPAEGKNADYVPALAKVDPNLFGIALVTVDGTVFTAGDVKGRTRSRVSRSWKSVGSNGTLVWRSQC